MPTFCRHNRFVERCPICSKTLPGAAAGARAPAGAPKRRAGGGSAGGARRSRSEGLRVRHEGRAAEDGYRSELVQGLRASADAERLAQEIAFGAGRIGVLAAAPPGLYREARLAAGAGELERALWICFLTAYLCPIEGEEDPFAGIRAALALMPDPIAGESGPLADLDGIPLGPRTSHDRARGSSTLAAYRQWIGRAGGSPDEPGGPSQAVAFTGDPSWAPQRRFERIYERFNLPGLTRPARFDLLVTIGRLGLLEMSADSLHFSGGRGAAGSDDSTAAAKRVFGIGDSILLERRAATLASLASVPLEALDPALASWGAAARATLGVPADSGDAGALERVRAVLDL